jgi:hypothetical protein
MERAISAVRANVAIVAARTDADRRTIAQASSLRASERAAAADLRSFAGSGGGDTLLNALRAVQISARSTGVSLIGVDPDAISPGEATFAGRLQALRVTLRVRGRFADLVQFLADLSHHGVPIEVSAVRIAPAAAAKTSSAPAIDATIPAAVYRIAGDPGKESSHAASR